MDGTNGGRGGEAVKKHRRMQEEGGHLIQRGNATLYEAEGRGQNWQRRQEEGTTFEIPNMPARHSVLPTVATIVDDECYRHQQNIASATD